jgi:hypothetical protein
MNHRQSAFLARLVSSLLLLIAMPGFVPAADVGELERQYYELDYKMRQWVKLQEANKQIIVPPGFQDDLERYNQLAAQLGVARAEQAAEIAAEDEGKKSIIGMIATRDTVDKAVELVDAKIADLNKESEFYEEWYKKWLEDSKTDTGVAITANDAASPAQRDWNKLQQMKDEAVRRQREIENKIEALENKKKAMQYGMTGVKTLLAASDIKDAISEGNFFDAADKTIDAGSGIAEVVYDEKTFKKASERIGAGKSGLGAAKKIWEGEYLDGSIDAVDTVDSLIEDMSKDHAKESATLQMFMESDFTDPALKKQALQVIDIANTRKIDLEKVMAMKNKVQGVGKVLKTFQNMKGWYNAVMGEIQGYKQLASEPGRSGTTTRLIAGMSKLGMIFKEGAGYLPPGLSQTIGQFLEFYGDALQLGDEIDKKIRDYFEKRGDCLNVVGGLQNTYCVEQIEKMGGRDELCLNYAPEFRGVRLPMFVDIGLGKEPPRPCYFYIPDSSRAPTPLTDAQYTTLIKIASDYGAYCTILKQDYQLTAEDLGSIIDAVINNKPEFTINNGVIYDSTFKIKDLAEDVRVLLHVKEALGDQLTPDNARDMIKAWLAFENDVSFPERACGFTICDNERERNRLFVTYLESRDSFYNFIERQKLTQPDSRCRATVLIKGPDIVASGEAVTYEAAPNQSLQEAKEVKYVWRELPSRKDIGTGPSLPYTFERTGTFGIQLLASGKAGGSPMDLAKAELMIEVQEPGAGDYVFEITGPEAVPVGQPAVLKSSLRGLNRRGRELLENSRIRWYVGENAIGVGEYCTVEGRPAGPYTVTAHMLTETNGKFTVTDSRQHTVTVSDEAGRAQVGVAISGPSSVKAGAEIRLSATVTARDASSRQLVDRSAVSWAVGDTVIERGNTMWADAGAPGNYEVTASVVVDFNGRESVLARATHRWTVTGPGDGSEPTDTTTEPPKPETTKPKTEEGPGGAKTGKRLFNFKCSPPQPTTKGGAILSVGVNNPPKNVKYYWEIGDKPSKDYLAVNETPTPTLSWSFSRTGKQYITVMVRDFSLGDKYDKESLVDYLVAQVDVSDAYVKISAPTEVYEGDQFNVTVEIPAELAKEVRTYKWSLNAMDGMFFKPDKFEMYGTKTVETKTPTTVFQASRRYTTADKRSELQICCEVRKDDSAFGALAQAMSGVIKVKPPDLTLAQSGWTLTEDAVEQYRLTRNPMRRTVTLSKGGTAEISVDASVNVRMGLSDSAQAYKGDPITSGKFKGAVSYREKPYTDAYEASADGGMQHVKSIASIYGEVKGTQSTKNQEAATVLASEGRKALEEMKAAIRGFSIRSHEEVTNATPSELAVELVPDKKILNYGDVVKVVAKVSGGTEPYQLTWSGNHGKGSDPTEVLFAASTPGEHSLSVSVTDSEGKSASASVTLTLDTYKVEIALQGDAKVTLGDSRAFTATVKAGETVYSRKFEYQWEPHPEVVFEPHAGPENQTTAKFTKPGPVKVWVAVLENKDGKMTTVGESDQIELEVVEPGLQLVAQPMEPMIGETVHAVVSTEGGIDDADISFWWEIKGNVLNAGPLADEHEYSFVVKDTAPITLIVHAKAKDGGDDLGQKDVTVKAKQYDVKIGEPRLMGPPPQVWDPKKGGLVEVPRAIGVNRDFSVKVSVSPAPADASTLRYQWSVSPEECVVMSPASQETRCNARAAGSYSLKVVVRNADGGELGIGTREVSVVQSDDPAKVNDSSAKLAQAKQLYQQDKLDDAINMAQAASALNSKNPEPSQLVSKWTSEKQAVMQQLAKAQTMANAKRFEEAFAALGEAKNLHAQYPPVIQAETLLNHLKAKADEGKKQTPQQPTNTSSTLKDAFINTTSAPAGSLWGTGQPTSGTKPATPVSTTTTKPKTTTATQTKPQTSAATQAKPPTTTATPVKPQATTQTKQQPATQQWSVGPSTTKPTQVAKPPTQTPTATTQAKPPQTTATTQAKPPMPQTTAKPKPPTQAPSDSGAPRLAGTSWQGQVTLQTEEGGNSVPLKFTVAGNNSISGALVFSDPESGQSQDMPVGGSYNPASGQIQLQFVQKIESITMSLTMSGIARSPDSLAGAAVSQMDGPDAGGTRGTWQASRTR